MFIRHFVVASCLFAGAQAGLSFAEARAPEGDAIALTTLLQEKACPTLRDYYRFIGEGTESELRMELAACAEKGFSPTPDDARCVEYTRRRAELADEVPSFYLMWLKSRFPAKGPVAVTQVKEVKQPNVLEHQLITARVGTVEIVFFRQLGTSGPFGRIDVVSIGGAPVAQLFEEEMKRRGNRPVGKP
jgi:hypothetical protein